MLRLNLIALAFAGIVHGDDASARIDALLAQDWQTQKLTRNPTASDETFVRRLYLDVVGRIPTLEEAQSFLSSKDEHKRAKLIDQLLASEGYTSHLFHFWADILRVQSRANGGQGEMTSKPYLEHVKKRIRENLPYDQFVRELLTAQGKVWDNPAIGYYMRDLGMPLDNLSNTARIFLGTRIECAQCHNHPFDKWTQMQFYQMAAFTYPQETNFTGIMSKAEVSAMRRKAESKPETLSAANNIGRIFENLGDFVRYSKVQALPERELKLPHDYKYDDAKPFTVIAPATMLGAKTQCKPGDDTLKAYADWLTSSQNPRFTTVIANRLWKKVFGLGLIEPVDDLNDESVAMIPPLMKHLEQLMIAGRYDVKAFLRVLLNTQAYQSDVTPREIAAGEVYHFTGPVLRRLTAEQIYDSFVTLIQPTPDLPQRHGIDSEVAKKLVYRGKLSDALDLLTPQEIFDGTVKASAAYDAIGERAKVLRVQYTAAQKAKDKPLMEKLNLEIRSLEFTARTSIHDHIVVPAVARLYTKKTGKEAPPPIPVRKPTLDELKKPGQQRDYIAVPGYDIDQAIPRDEQAAADARDTIFKAEAQRFGITDVKAFLNARRDQAREWPRAAELESPAPRGHFLREFGQSDRDLIENSNHEASMPQALVLMNSTLYLEIVKPFTQLRLALAKAKYPDDQLDLAYLTLLTRKPTESERNAWATAQQHGLDSIEDLIFAIINTRQFIFVR